MAQLSETETMQDYQRTFISFCLSVEALKFGEFRLKSGRKSPYFFNSGSFDWGIKLARLGQFYASAITNEVIGFDLLYGPAYKGIPIVSATAIALAEHHDRNVPYSFNRKEPKDHGEGGDIIGASLGGKVLIVDDVITAGTSVRESVEIIRAHGAEPVGVVISLDRQEKGIDTGESAVQQVQSEFDTPVIPIVTLADLIEYLEQEEGELQKYLSAIRAYQEEYGV